MELFKTSVKLQAIYNYYGILTILFISVLLLSIWKIWKNEKRYASLPTYPNIFFETAYEYVFKKQMKIPLATVLFHKFDSACKLFEEDGMFYCWLLRRIFIIFDEEHVKVFATDEASSDKSIDYNMLKEAFGDGLVTTNGVAWKKDRKTLNPIFHPEALKDMLPIFNKNATILVKELAESVDKPVADMHLALVHCTFHTLCESVFDVDISKSYKRTAEELSDIMIKLGEFMTSRWLFPPTFASFVKFCTPSGWQCLKNYKLVRTFCKEVLYPVKEIVSSKTGDLKEDAYRKQKTFAEVVLQRQLKDQSFTINYAYDHVVTLTAGGTETVLYTLMYSLFLLGHHKDVQQKAFEEIESVADEFVTFENLCQLQYLDCIIKETLRLYPTIPAFARRLNKDIKLGKYTVPKGMTVVFFLNRLHKDPKVYKDPENFDPDRFSTNSENKKFAHIPFSEGYRNCIGKKFAMLEMKVILAYILRNYEVTSLQRREDVDFSWRFLLVPTNPLRMRITARKSTT